MPAQPGSDVARGRAETQPPDDRGFSGGQPGVVEAGYPGFCAGVQRIGSVWRTAGRNRWDLHKGKCGQGQHPHRRAAQASVRVHRGQHPGLPVSVGTSGSARGFHPPARSPTEPETGATARAAGKAPGTIGPVGNEWGKPGSRGG